MPLKSIYAAAPPDVADAMWPHIEDYPSIKDKEVARVALKSAPAHEGAKDRFLIGLDPRQGRRLCDHAELGRPELDDGRPRGRRAAARPRPRGRGRGRRAPFFFPFGRRYWPFSRRLNSSDLPGRNAQPLPPLSAEQP